MFCGLRDHLCLGKCKEENTNKVIGKDRHFMYTFVIQVMTLHNTTHHWYSFPQPPFPESLHKNHHSATRKPYELTCGALHNQAVNITLDRCTRTASDTERYTLTLVQLKLLQVKREKAS